MKTTLKLMDLLKNREFIVLSVILLLSLFVRFYNFPGNVYFGYDQSRDAYVASEICAGDIKILGPPTSRQGLFHGPLYWYIIAPAYCFSSNPLFAAGLLRILNLVSVILIFLVAKKLFGTKVSIISALIFAVSFENWQSAIYFSNPGPAAVTVLLFHLGLVSVIKKSRMELGLILTAVGFGLSVQSQFYLLIYLSFLLFVMALVFRRTIISTVRLRDLLAPLIIVVFLLSTFIISEIKFKFTHITGYFLRGESDIGLSSIDSIIVNWSDRMKILFFDTMGIPMKDSVTPSIFLGIVLLISLWSFYAYKKSNVGQRESLKYIIVWILSGLVLFVFGLHNFYYMVGVSSAMAILLGYLLSRSIGNNYVLSLIVGLIVLGNLYNINKQVDVGLHHGITVQTGLLYPNEIEVVDYIYNESDSEKYVVSAFTMPYDIFTTWAYLFNSYGVSKYGYVPFWIKEMPLGYKGSMPLVEDLVCDRYVIYESARGLESLRHGFVAEQELTSELVDSRQFGEIIVEKRIDRACL